MAFPFWIKKFKRPPHFRWTVVRSYRAISSASVDIIWGKISTVTDISWNPMLASIDAPFGLKAKPGLIYRAASRMIPVPFQLFVETVRPHQFISIRVLSFPGLEERITYQIGADVKGTIISYSIMLRGWLTPLIWLLLHQPARKVAQQLATAAESEGLQSWSSDWRSNLTGL